MPPTREKGAKETRNPFYKHPRFKSSEFQFPTPAWRAASVSSGLKRMESSKMEMPGNLLFYLRGSTPSNPSQSHHCTRTGCTAERGANTAAPTELGVELRVRAYRASPAPCLESRWRETRRSTSRGCPHGSERTLSGRALSPPHSPVPGRSSGSLRSQRPSGARPQPFPPPDPAGPVPACAGSGAGEPGWSM